MDEIEREALLSSSGEDEDLELPLDLDTDRQLQQTSISSSVSEYAGGSEGPKPSTYPSLPGDVAAKVLRSWAVVELRKLIKLSVPVMLLMFFQQFVYISAVLFAGHISGTSLELDAVSLAISVSNVTGYSVIIGLAAAADTLCPQSFGFKNYKRVGEVFQQGLLILSIAALPVAAIWINSESILLLLHQPPCVVPLASQFLRIFILILPALIVTQMMQKYLQAQSVVWVFALTGILYNIFFILIVSVLMYGFHQGVYSIAVSMVVGAYLATLFLILYVKGRGLHKLTWGGWSFRSLENWWLFLKLGLPGFLMLAFEWWTFEISVLVSGSLGEMELGVNTVLLQLLTLLFALPMGIGTAASVRVGNELGAGHAQQAKRSAYAAVGLQFCIVSCLVVILGLSHSVVGKVFTKDEAVIQETSYTMYAAITLIFFDQMQGTIGGVFRGAGLQAVAAVVNFFVYYVVGLPIGVCLALLTSLGTLGMWIGLSIGSVSQFTIYTVILVTINWSKLAKKAMKNAGGSPSAVRQVPTSPTHSGEDSTANSSPTVGHLEAREALAASFEDSPHSNGDMALVSYEGISESHLPEESVRELVSEERAGQLVPEETHEQQTVGAHQRRQRVRLVVCRVLVVLVGVCLVVVSGVLAGVFHHPQLDSCNAGNSCCTLPPATTDSNATWPVNPTAVSAISPSHCVCASVPMSLTLSPTPHI